MWDERFVFCGVLCCVVMCVGAGVGVQYVVCGVCCVCGVVCVVCVARLGTRKTHPCVGSKRLRVQVQNASVCIPAKRVHVEHMRAFCRFTRRRFEPTQEDVLNLHTECLSLLSFSLSLVLSFLSSFVHGSDL